MGMYKRYEGEFLSRKGVIWRAEIWQEADAQFPVVGELRFPADNPLSIEWAHTDKEEVICGSTASLTIVSPGDRTYEDLYTIQPGRVRLDTYRNGNLYWSGTLDPEFYEEPYCEAKEYDVQLTFSDFGILDRYKYRLGGVQTLFDLVKHCADMSGICYGDIRQDYISTSLDGQNAMSLSDLSIRSENFYDEEMPIVKIKLDPLLTPSQNAQKYYKEYKKADTAEKMLTELIKKGEQEQIYIDSVFDVLSRSSTEAEIAAIRAELVDGGYLRANKNSRQKPQKLSYIKYKSSDGFTILCGRNNLQNDRLTLKESNNYDMWFHTQNIPGSHTVVVCEGLSEIPDKTIEEAAMIAAYNSKARNSTKVAVDYTLIKNIKKPNGSKPGFVVYDTYYTLLITPDEEQISSLLEK